MDEILIKACGVTYRKGQYITGVGRSTLELMKALSKINNLPFKLYYYTTGLRANNMDRTDIDFQYFKIPFPDKIIHITELDVLYRKYILRPNLVHIPHNYDDSYKEENLLLTVIDFADDASDINRSAYKWADIYAKVNINKSFTLFYAYNKIVDYNRIIQLPPYFGIKIWNSYQTIFYCITNYIKSLSNRSVGIHVHIKDYLLQYVHRSRLSYYETPSLKNNGNNYVFFASNLWNIENCNDTTNLIRERFIIACTKNKKIDFEGGFIIPPNHPLKEKYLKYAISKRYNIHEYLDKIKKSKIVFNTPAVHFCHGWKLGEYFCLGKIILSTNFQNNIPNGIQDRKNILFVDPKNIEEIINTITNDISFQNELQQNALSYWKNSACPQKVIEHLISYSNRKL